MLPCARYRITELWNDATRTYESEPKQIGKLIVSAGLERSGRPRGDASKGDGLLRDWQADSSRCRTNLTEAEVMRVLLGIKPGKRPGTTGVVGEAYKLAAATLAPVFMEAFADIQDTAFDFTSVPEHICETLWSPIAKKTRRRHHSGSEGP